MEIGFLGGTGTVTGSKFLVHDNGTRILVDCGLFQGLKEYRLLNWNGFPFDPKDINAVVLTHSHLDHCGALPLLVRKGFTGPIYCSEPTLNLSKIILLDSAKIQEEDAEYANKKGFSKHRPALPLYTEEDVEKTLPLMRSQKLHEKFQIGSLTIEFFGAGHILGAATVLISNKEKTVCFSGDLGRSNDPLMWPPEPPPESDYIVMESTYGDRNHSQIPSKKILRECILEIAKNNGTLLIPSFAVGRTQNLIYELVNLKRAGEIPSSIPIYLNSPMGHSVSELYEKFAHYQRLGPGQFAELMSEIHSVKSVEESKGLNLKPGPMVILAASGMLTGGRVLHHLKAIASNPENIILLAGYQGVGTRGWSLLNGAKDLKVHGSYIDVKCKVVPSDSFSAHADQTGLLNWLSSSESKPQKVFLVHGESAASDDLRRRIKDKLGWDVVIPKMNQIVSI
ncbi:MAG: MBL fold metallo-hydrolase RNA specificity domain-containing protein [Pseudobdellovibrionaceae bacterium]